MTVRALNNTPAARAAARPQRPPVYSQEQLRDRRRKHLPYVLDGRWSLTEEVAAICSPLARSVAAAPNPAGYWRSVDEIALAVHGLVHAVVGVLAEADARRRTAHLDVDSRGRSIRALVDLTARPKLPEIADEALISGAWTATLVALAEPHSGELNRLLGNALTSAVSDRLTTALRDVDSAALTLARRLDRDERARSCRARRTTPTPTDQARAELAALGINA